MVSDKRGQQMTAFGGKGDIAPASKNVRDDPKRLSAGPFIVGGGLEAPVPTCEVARRFKIYQAGGFTNSRNRPRVAQMINSRPTKLLIVIAVGVGITCVVPIAAQTLKKEPEANKLLCGQKVLVENNTCPADQILEVPELSQHDTCD